MSLRVQRKDEVPSCSECTSQPIRVQPDIFTPPAHNLAGASARIDDLLAPWSPHRIISPESRLDPLGRRSASEKRSQHGDILESLSGTGPLPGRHRVGGIARNAHAAVGVGWRRLVFPLRIAPWGRLVERELKVGW